MKPIVYYHKVIHDLRVWFVRRDLVRVRKTLTDALSYVDFCGDLKIREKEFVGKFNIPVLHEAMKRDGILQEHPHHPFVTESDLLTAINERLRDKYLYEQLLLKRADLQVPEHTSRVLLDVAQESKPMEWLVQGANRRLLELAYPTLCPIAEATVRGSEFDDIARCLEVEDDSCINAIQQLHGMLSPASNHDWYKHIEDEDEDEDEVDEIRCDACDSVIIHLMDPDQVKCALQQNWVGDDSAGVVCDECRRAYCTDHLWNIRVCVGLDGSSEMMMCEECYRMYVRSDGRRE